MSRTQIDQFIDDDEEETCPLCVEEFDLSDRGFRPCPCGYQICQFCYHNVRNNMNGLCPACRRPYDDANIVFSKPSPDEEIAWRARQAAKAKKNTIAAQKEAQKREADTLSRKHLAGLRVVQKNLVYVTGLSPSVQEDRLLETLRGPAYFGQYGKIVKIVVSKAKEPHTQSVGVYVTYARKIDAAMCIEAVDGSQNGDRVLRAQFGTTKYCSAYLRNEQCTNRNCMFLHEPGEDNESFTRQDLSSMNVISTQQPSSEQSPTQPPPQVAPVAAAHYSVRQEAMDIPQSPIDTPGRPALPSTASWASKAPQMTRQLSAASRSTSGAYPSPTVSAATPKKETPKPDPVPEPASTPAPAPAPVEPERPAEPVQPAQPVQPAASSAPPPRRSKQVQPSALLVDLFKSFAQADLKFDFSTNGLSEEEIDTMQNFPSLFDEHGGVKRRALRQREDEERRRLEEAQQIAMQNAQNAVAAEQPDENEEARGGSLQLGGEPEDHPDQPQAHALQAPNQLIDDSFVNVTDMLNPNVSRRLTPQQHQQLLLQQFKPVQNQPSLPNQAQPGNAPGHARNVSRYTFANDSSSASASVKPVANSKLMSQQSTMMPPNALQQQAPAGFYSTNVQGPPPGLKTTGTPPFSGGGMFGQGHGFATSGLGYGANLTGRSPNDEMMRDLLRTRNLGGGSGGAAGGSQVSSDAGKRGGALSAVDVADPSILQARLHQAQAQAAGHNGGLAFAGQGGGGGGQELSDFHLTGLGLPPHFSPDLFNDARVGTPPVPPGFEGVRTPGLEGLGQQVSQSGVNSPVLGVSGLGLGYGLESPRRATPTIPPGFTFEHLSQPPSRSSSRASARVGKSDKDGKERIVPAVPVLSAHGPVRAGTPLREVVKVREREEHATPTKAGKRGKKMAEKKAASEAAGQDDEMKVATTEADATAGAEREEEVKPKKAAESTKKAVEAVQEPVKTTDETSSPSPRPESSSRPELSSRPASSSRPELSSRPDSSSRPKSAAQLLAEKHAQSQQAKLTTSSSPPLTAAQMLEQRHRKAEAERASSRPGSRATSPSRSRAPSPSPVKDGKKKQHPGKLDIGAAVTKSLEGPTGSGSNTPAPVSATTAKPGAVIRTLPMPTPSTISRPGTPSVSSALGTTDSPAKKTTAPRTLRVVATPTPKTENAPTLPNVPAGEFKSVVSRLPSRQPSIASIQLPGTPSSDHAHGSFISSDNISVTSTSFSRASSPPPGFSAPISSRVGSAPVRAKTKNQQKKDRQERARQIEEEKLMVLNEAEGKGAAGKDDGVVHEAIMGRKRKSKKPSNTVITKEKREAKETKAQESKVASPAPSQPSTPQLGTPRDEAPPSNVAPADVAAVTPAPTGSKAEPVESSPAPLPEPEKYFPEPERLDPSPEPEQEPTRLPSPPPAPVMTPQTLINSLRADSPLLASSIDTFLRPLTQSTQTFKPTQNLLPQDLGIPRSLERNPDVNIKAVNLEYMWAHDSGLRYGGEDGRVWSRGVVTPGGAHLRHLEEGWEERFIRLEEEVRARDAGLRYWPDAASKANELVSQLLASVYPAQAAAAAAAAKDDANDGHNRNTASAAGLKLEDVTPRIDLVKLKRVLEDFERYGGRRDANAMEKAVEEGSKKGSFLVDTAGKYVNEFVLPTFGAPGQGQGGVGGDRAPQQQQQQHQQSQQPAVGVGAGGVGATSAVAKLGPVNLGHNGVGAGLVEGRDEGGAVQDFRVGVSVAEAERMLVEAKRGHEEREAQFRKVVKRNRKMVGLTH